MPGPVFDGYLDALEASLEISEGERAEIREEIGAHLGDLRAELVETGLSPDRAGEEAIRRLGPPQNLARDLTRARQTRRALLAAVGGATWAATGAAVRGLILGVAGVTVAVMTAMVGMAVATRLLGDGTWTLWDAGWFTTVGVTAAWVSVAFAGRAFVSVVARRSHRPAERVRPWVAAIGGTLIGWAALAWFTAPQNVASVIALALVPIIFVAATLTASDRPIERSRRERVASLALLVTLVVAVPLLGWMLATPVGTTQLSSVGSVPYASMQELLHATGFDLPGRSVPDPPELGTIDSGMGGGFVTASLGNAAAVATRWHDLRLEAWRAAPEGGSIDRAWSTPFANAPLTVESGRLVGAVRVDRTRDISQWWVVVTGVAADGGRDLVVTIMGGNSTFTGSVVDWLTAP